MAKDPEKFLKELNKELADIKKDSAAAQQIVKDINSAKVLAKKAEVAAKSVGE